VLERGGRALILPAPSGSGKSTLCAALAFSGWRLLSDELALLAPDHGMSFRCPDPSAGKNESIEAVRLCFLKRSSADIRSRTIKGRVVHVSPGRFGSRAEQSAFSVCRLRQGSWPRRCLPEAMPEAAAMMCLVSDSAFNYNVHGRNGFAALSTVVDRSALLPFHRTAG
jgi:hypothetical protein